MSQELQKLKRWRQFQHSQGRTVAFVNGCFDILHEGHLCLLEQARRAADKLVLAVNSDASVQRRKGPSRPIQPESIRLRIAARMARANISLVFDDDDPRELLAAIRPNIYVMGSDYRDLPIPGAEFCGRVVFVDRLPGVSTTKLVERLAGCRLERSDASENS